jgi:hypothetical protein
MVSILQNTNLSSILYQYRYKIFHCFYSIRNFLMTLIFDTSIKSIGSVSCTYHISNPTPVYVVDGSDAVLQCGFESSNLNWDVFYGVG